jgi:hypothetical protein
MSALTASDRRPPPADPNSQTNSKEETVDGHHSSGQATTTDSRLHWLVSVAHQIANEAGLDCTANIEDLVAITYVGLLDSPLPNQITHERLLERSRQQLTIWAWEQGQYGEPFP